MPDENEPILSEDEGKELEEQSYAGAVVRELVESKGWQEVLLPALRNRQAALLKKTKCRVVRNWPNKCPLFDVWPMNQYKDLIQMSRPQLSLSEITYLFDAINATMKLGDIADQRLQKDKIERLKSE